MDVFDADKYQSYHEAKETWNPYQVFYHEIFLPFLLFGGMGAFCWAMRGTSGWGGFDGAVIPGLTWGLLLYYIFQQRGLDIRVGAFFLGLGIAIGGMLGYGQYISWIRGIFYVNGSSDTLPINPLLGYVWLWVVGAVWGGIGGILLGWSLRGEVDRRTWLLRLLIPIGFIGIGFIMMLIFPSGFFPNFSIYSSSTCADCSRTFETNLTNTIFLMWWFGVLFTALLERDFITLKCGLLLGIVFGLALSFSASYTLAPGWETNADIDWWKVWELSSGLIGGLGLAILIPILTNENNICFKEDTPREEDHPHVEKIELLLKKVDSQTRFFPDSTLYKNLLLIFHVSILLLVVIYGGTYMLGVNLELYESSAIGQYEFPIERFFTFILGSVIVFFWFIFNYKKLLDYHVRDEKEGFYYPIKPILVIEVACVILVFGVITIYPSGLVLYYIVLFWIGFGSLILMDLQGFVINNEEQND